MGIELPFATLEAVASFLLVFFRMTGMTISAPLFSNQSFPVQLRVWAAFVVALVVFPVAVQRVPAGAVLATLEHPLHSIAAVAGELAIGWLIGFIGSAAVWAAQLTGHLVGQEIGLTIGEVFDPVSDSQLSPFGTMFFTVALLVFVLLGGHHLLVMALVQSFEVAPLADFPVSYELGDFLTRTVGSQIWSMGLQAALPIMLALLLVSVAMAILARAVPEMNIFILGFSLRIGLGLLALVVVLPFVIDLFQTFLGGTEQLLTALLSVLGGGG
ncbi:MAG: flagellar biosynthetic protein FliR [Planctomycetota bacterium]